MVITDFEPMTAYLAYTNDLPLITIDNQHRMRYMQYDGPAHRIPTDAQPGRDPCDGAAAGCVAGDHLL